MKVERSVEVSAPPQQRLRRGDGLHAPGRLGDHPRLTWWATRRAGSRRARELTQCLKLAGRRFKVRWTVVENDPCRRVVWEGRGPVASHARVEYGFEANGDGTHFTYLNQYDLPGGPLGRLAERTVARATARELDGSLQRLKALVE